MMHNQTYLCYPGTCPQKLDRFEVEDFASDLPPKNWTILRLRN
jgi:hypothetical protein